MVFINKASGKWLTVVTIKFIYRVAQYSLVKGYISHTAHIGEKGKKPKCVYKDIKLSKCIPTRNKKEWQELRSKVLEIDSRLRYYLRDPIRDIKARDTHSQESLLGYIG